MRRWSSRRRRSWRRQPKGSDDLEMTATPDCVSLVHRTRTQEVGNGEPWGARGAGAGAAPAFVGGCLGCGARVRP